MTSNAIAREVAEVVEHLDVTRMLGGLRDSGLLQMIGGGRGARYQLDPNVALFAESGMVTRKSSEPSSSRHVVLSTIDSQRSSIGLDASTTDSLRELFDDPNGERLESIAAPVRNSDYIRASERDDIILQLCRIKPFSLLELTWLLGRNKMYVRTVLRELINNNKLQYLHPDKPRHPHQRYLATKQTTATEDE